MPEHRYMDIAEFRQLGLLQEVNRRFFHPMGLALEIAADKDGTKRLSGVRDHRDDPEGVVFEEGLLSGERAERVRQMEVDKVDARMRALGYYIQPVPWPRERS